MDLHHLSPTRTWIKRGAGQHVAIDRDEFHADHAIRARLLQSLALSGMPVVTDPLPQEMRDLLGEALSQTLETLSVALLADEDLVDQVVATAMRQAMHHRVGSALPSISIIAATRRPERLAIFARTLERQQSSLPSRAQVIVALHGHAFGAHSAALIRRHCPQATVLQADPRQPFGAVLQAACQRAEGDLLTKMDDDDHYAAHHVWDLALTATFRAVPLVGRAAEFVHLHTPDVTIRRRFAVTSGLADTVAGGTIMITRAMLGAVGGWPGSRRFVDRDLLTAVRRAGGTIFRSMPFGYLLVRHGQGHTWHASDDWFLNDAVRHWRGCAREQAGITAG
ncbi:MAG: glycosyltransferase [Euzebya sp.]